MKTVRSLIHAEPDSTRMVRVDGDDLTIRICGKFLRFPESHEFSILDNLDFLVDGLSKLKSDLESMETRDEK